MNLPLGASATYTANCAVAAAATGTLVNTATVASSATVADSNTANNSATDTDTITALSADLAITKTDGVPSTTPGGNVTYTIVASNATGPNPVTGVTVADTFPASLTCTWTCAGTGGGACAASGTGNINDTSVNLPVGASATYTANCAVAAAATGTLVNTATIASSAIVADPNTANNSATDTDTLDATAITTFSGPTATGTGIGTAVLTGLPAGCGFKLAEFIPLEGHPHSPPAGTAPASAAFTHGLFNFQIGDKCGNGFTATITLTYPQPLAAGTQYYKYGPTPTNPTPDWYVLPATISGATVSFILTDGQLGDDDLTANGAIVDQGGPGEPVTAIPTLGWWALLITTLGLLWTVRIQRRRLSL
ncbi:MAG: DUF11 domain-containing protein [Gammaproteobacteria bacterium]